MLNSPIKESNNKTINTEGYNPNSLTFTLEYAWEFELIFVTSNLKNEESRSWFEKDSHKLR